MTQEASKDIDDTLQIAVRFARVTQQKLIVEETKVCGTAETALQSATDFVVNGEHHVVVKKLK